MDPMGMCSEDVLQWENEWKIPLGHVLCHLEDVEIRGLAKGNIQGLCSPHGNHDAHLQPQLHPEVVGKIKISGIPIANLTLW